MFRKNIKLSIEYDGTNYSGWQIQPDQRTIQGEIKDKLELILQETITLYGASRTDAKVHAREQIANFTTYNSITPAEILNKLNKLLPMDIRIKQAEIVDENFNSRMNAKKKLYQYFIFNSNINSAFYRNYCWHISDKININLLNELSKEIIGEHNFLSFSGQKCTSKTFVRKIYNANWSKKGDFYIFKIEGNAFLKNMVRKIVGSLLAINLGKENRDFLQELISIKNRARAKYCAPPQGLFLEKIFY